MHIRSILASVLRAAILAHSGNEAHDDTEVRRETIDPMGDLRIAETRHALTEARRLSAEAVATLNRLESLRGPKRPLSLRVEVAS